MAKRSSSADIASRYARALFHLAPDTKTRHAMLNDLAVLSDLAESHEDFRRFLRLPMVTPERKVAVMQAIAEKAAFTPLIRRVLVILAENDRLQIIPRVADALRALVQEAEGILPAELTMAVAPTSDQVASVKQALDRATGKNVQLSARQDPEILGGLVVRYGSTMIDGSLSNRLETLRRKLKAAAA